MSQQVRDRAAVLEQERRPYVEISKSLGGTGELLTNPLLEVLKKAEAGVQAASATSGGAFSADSLKAIADAEIRKRRGQ